MNAKSLSLTKKCPRTERKDRKRQLSLHIYAASLLWITLQWEDSIDSPVAKKKWDDHKKRNSESDRRKSSSLAVYHWLNKTSRMDGTGQRKTLGGSRRGLPLEEGLICSRRRDERSVLSLHTMQGTSSHSTRTELSGAGYSTLWSMLGWIGRSALD